MMDFLPVPEFFGSLSSHQLSHKALDGSRPEKEVLFLLLAEIQLREMTMTLYGDRCPGHLHWIRQCKSTVRSKFFTSKRATVKVCDVPQCYKRLVTSFARSWFDFNVPKISHRRTSVAHATMPYRNVRSILLDALCLEDSIEEHRGWGWQPYDFDSRRLKHASSMTGTPAVFPQRPPWRP
jgi:hypothetical protein